MNTHIRTVSDLNTMSIQSSFHQRQLDVALEVAAAFDRLANLNVTRRVRACMSAVAERMCLISINLAPCVCTLHACPWELKHGVTRTARVQIHVHACGVCTVSCLVMGGHVTVSAYSVCTASYCSHRLTLRHSSVIGSTAGARASGHATPQKSA